MIALYQEAVASGARREPAAAELALPSRTLRRWIEADGTIKADGRPEAVRPAPSNRLSEVERAEVLKVCHSKTYGSLPPSQIVPRLADQGIYLASESTFYRILKAADQQHHRGRAKAPRESGSPPSHRATRPNQVWCWDITYCPSPVRGMFWYLYAVMDVYSRKIVAWEIHDKESGDYASELVERAVLREGCRHEPLVLHSDNGSPMKSSTLRMKLLELGVTSSYSRPRVSNDNAYAESLFRTLKYCPQWPVNGFDTLVEARRWMIEFERFYNHEHRHSQIRFVTPAERHRGEDKVILARRTRLYETAKARYPERWGSRMTRNWRPVGDVLLNPCNDENQLAQAA